ncbi:MAG: Zn-ribbon domain-containing OB-fold protein [Acidimicrobiales bacterium]
MSTDVVAPRILPELTDLNRPFWTGGRDGQLLIQRCASCGRWQHPPAESCTACGGPLAPQPVSGKGEIFTFTVNWHQYHPQVPPPYPIAVVELIEQADLRLPTNIVGCEHDELRCGLAVHVVFEQHGEHFVPLFEPDR